VAFKKMQRAEYPPRLWCLVGYPGSGKSTFAAKMRGPLLVVDADHRFQEVLDLAEGDVYALSEAPADQVDADRIAAILAANMPGSGVRTIVIDSLTAIITPLVVQALRDKDAGRAKNLFAAWRDKALAARQLQDSVTRWGCDTLWIYHLQDSRDAQGQELTKATLSETERARLTRSINLQLEIVEGQDGGRSGLTLWDDSGDWTGMPEAIEGAVYDGLSEADRDRLEGETPAAFPNPETAIAWGLDQGAFKALQHARNAYNKLKAERKPKTAQEMATLWIADVEARLEALASDIDDAGTDPAQGELPLDVSGEGAEVSQEPVEVSQDGQDGSSEGSELDQAFPRFEDGAAVPEKALPYYEQYFQAKAKAPASLDALRTWAEAQQARPVGAAGG
jgi:hypothetical protein